VNPLLVNLRTGQAQLPMDVMVVRGRREGGRQDPLTGHFSQAHVPEPRMGQAVVE
jgi:hypothetical protein